MNCRIFGHLFTIESLIHWISSMSPCSHLFFSILAISTNKGGSYGDSKSTLWPLGPTLNYCGSGLSPLRIVFFLDWIIYLVIVSLSGIRSSVLNISKQHNEHVNTKIV